MKTQKCDIGNVKSDGWRRIVEKMVAEIEKAESAADMSLLGQGWAQQGPIVTIHQRRAETSSAGACHHIIRGLFSNHSCSWSKVWGQKHTGVKIRQLCRWGLKRTTVKVEQV